MPAGPHNYFNKVCVFMIMNPKSPFEYSSRTFENVLIVFFIVTVKYQFLFNSIKINNCKRLKTATKSAFPKVPVLIMLKPLINFFPPG